MSDSALSERRQSMGTKPWLDGVAVFLGKDDKYADLPETSYRGFRLVGIDGTNFNCGNTPSFQRTGTKVKSRRGDSAFFRIPCVTLCELSEHRPLAITIGENNESEGALAKQIINQLTEEDLLIADRYYGNGIWVGRLLSVECSPMFLLRVQERHCARVERNLTDGSKWVHVYDPANKGFHLVREIKAKVRRPGKPWTWVRFWTNLMDEKMNPAMELVSLYGMRWEQEIAFRELKHHLHSDPILLSHTLTTAVQEICALFMAQAIVAALRENVSRVGNIPVLQISFEKTLEVCRNLGWIWGIAKEEIGEDVMRKIIEKAIQELLLRKSKQRRQRSCPRKIRQPVSSWPRLIKPEYHWGQIEVMERGEL